MALCALVLGMMVAGVRPGRTTDGGPHTLAVSARADATGQLGVVGAAAPVPAGAVRLGAAPRSARLRLAIVLSPRDQTRLTSMVDGVSTAGNPLYRHYLRRGQFAAIFGASRSAVGSVRRTLAAAGISAGPLEDGLLLHAETTVGDAEAGLGVRIERFRLSSGQIVESNVNAPVLPVRVARVISSVSGLDGFDMSLSQPADDAHDGPSDLGAQSLTTVPGEPRPCAAARADGTENSYLTGPEVAQAYDALPLYRAGDFGQGVTLAVWENTGYQPSDIAVFQHCYGTHVPVLSRSVDGGNTDITAASEVDMDIDNIIELAPKISAVLVYVINDQDPTLWVDGWARIADDDAAEVVSTSWPTGCEAFSESRTENGLPTPQAEYPFLQQMVLQHQTVFSASGDNGSEACSQSIAQFDPTGLAVDDPASDPFVTAVGGTILQSIGSPPQRPPTEIAWPDSTGGISELWIMPNWQTGLGVINPYSTNVPCKIGPGYYCREVPDVSADAGTGYAIYDPEGDPTGNHWTSDNGTSGATPVWAAVTALIDASSPDCQAHPLGFLDPELYQAALTDPGDFNDITVGDNDVGDLNNGAYPATRGYDMVTGLGTPVAAALAQTLCPRKSTTTAVSSSADPAAVGTAVKLTARVSPDDGHGSVTFYLGTSSAPLCTAVGLTRSGSGAKATCTAKTLTLGRHTVTASYTGDRTGYLGSSGSISELIGKGPSAHILSPRAGGTYVYGQTVHTSFTCTKGTTSAAVSSCDDSTGTHTKSGGKGTLSTRTVGTRTYSVTATNTDGIHSAPAAIPYTVVKATPAVRWAAPASITYGTSLSMTQLDATASVPGSFSYKPAAGAVLAAGAETLTVTFTPAKAKDYNTVSAHVQLTVTQASQTINWPQQGPYSYGQTVRLTGTASSGLPLTYTVASGGCSPSGATLTFNSIGPCTLDAAQDGNGNYLPAPSQSQQITVNPAATILPATPAELAQAKETVSATLTSVVTDEAVAGQTISFTYQGDTLCEATTQSNGVASCTTSAPASNGSDIYTASYAGNSDYLASTGTATIQTIVL